MLESLLSQIYIDKMGLKFNLNFAISFIAKVSASSSSEYNGSPQLRGRSLNGGRCCSIDYMQCDASFCGLTKESCNTCEQDVDAAWIQMDQDLKGVVSKNGMNAHTILIVVALLVHVSK